MTYSLDLAIRDIGGSIVLSGGPVGLSGGPISGGSIGRDGGSIDRNNEDSADDGENLSKKHHGAG